jgi:hypothetical protein
MRIFSAFIFCVLFVAALTAMLAYFDVLVK